MGDEHVDTEVPDRLDKIPMSAIPFEQRTQWVATSIAAVLTSILVLTQLVAGLSSTAFQLLLVAISVGVVVAVYSSKSGHSLKIDWTKGADLLSRSRSRIELLVHEVPEDLQDKEQGVIRLFRLTTLRRSILSNRNYVRAAYRLALVQGEKDLAADILKELDEHTQWLAKIEGLIEQERAVH